ncbi:Rhs element Vgr protein [Leptolyngbya sp. NIES-3755]|nr:Rhs element Vgr protein [Leptolyngbya sp. NIES-3755]
MANLVASLRLELGGVPAPNNLIEDILQVSVEESLHLPAMFTLVISNPYAPGNAGDQPWQHESLFQFGQTVRIGFGESAVELVDRENSNYVIEGEITAIEAHFTADSRAPIVVRGYDCSHRLHRGRHNRSFQNMTDSDMVRKIAHEVGIPCGSIETTPGPHGYNDINGVNGYVFQENQTNMEFLRERASRVGFEFFVADGKLHFRKPAANNTLNLRWLQDITSFRARLSSAEQVSSVEVRGWDYSQKQSIVAVRHKEQVVTTTKQGNGTQTSQAFNGKPNAPSMIVIDQPVFTPQEAEMMAQALVDELGGEFIYADARAIGNPKIRPGRLIELNEMGKYSGRYYVTETRHLYSNGTYTTEFNVRGLRGGDLLSTLNSQQRLQPGQTHLIGIVTDNRDPKGWGRIRVMFPTLSEQHNSYWARMVQVGAGADRGFDCLPEIGDEVLVAFEHGDIHRPYILGGVWNGKDKTPEAIEDSINAQGNATGAVRLRTFKTRVGHQLQFSEEDPLQSSNAQTAIAGTELFGNGLMRSLKGIHLKTANNHEIDLCDQDRSNLNGVRLKTAQNQKLSLSDSPQNPGIALHSSIGQSISLIDRALTVSTLPQINLNTGGHVVINAGANSISPTGLSTAKQFLSLGAQAKTPGALNTFMSLLPGKIANSSSTIELSAGYVNQFSIGGVTIAAGQLSTARILPEQTYFNSPGITISASPSAGALDVPTPGMLNLEATTTIRINATTSVVITAPSITLNGAVNIVGSLLVNGRPPRFA